MLLVLLACAPTEPEHAAPPERAAPPSPAPPAPTSHGGVIRVVDGAHVEVLAHPDGVTVYLSDADMVPRDMPTGVWPSVWVADPYRRVDLQVDGPRGFAPLPLEAEDTVEVHVTMQFHASLKPSGTTVRLPVGIPTPDEPARHGGAVVPLGDGFLEYRAADGAHTVWFTDRHGHLEEDHYDLRLAVGDRVIERRGLGDTATLADATAGTQPVTLTVRRGPGVEPSAAGTFTFPPTAPAAAAPATAAPPTAPAAAAPATAAPPPSP